jgi:PAS domain S-box-containing protein
MKFISIAEIGVDAANSKAKNEKIIRVNTAGLLAIFLSISYVYLSIVNKDHLVIFGVLQIVSGVAILVFNGFGKLGLARLTFFIGVFGNFSTVHALILPGSGVLSVPFYTLQLSFLVLPWLFFDLTEISKLVVSTIFVFAVLLAIPFFDTIFVLEPALNQEILFGSFYLYLGLFSSGIILNFSLYLIVRDFQKANQENLLLLSVMKEKSIISEKNEEILNQYIKEVEKAHEEDKKRKWTSDGLAQFAEILRSEADFKVLSLQVISNLVKYLGASQGALFTVNENLRGELKLELSACYAYGRVKSFESDILEGEGLIGQCFLEKETIFLLEVPDDYLKIKSGLGEAKPSCLLVVPLKLNDIIEGVIEIASFEVLEDHQIAFVEKVAESIASVFTRVRITDRTKMLLDQSQQQTEELRAQEEEVRQNLEELMATQEEMERKQLENIAQYELMSLIIDNIPFPVFIKDENGRYTLVNSEEANIFNMPKSEIIGFDDSKFVIDKNEVERIQKSDDTIIEMNIPVYFPEQTLTLSDGTIKIFKTSKIPFYNKITQKTNILGVSVDLSDIKKLEFDLKAEIEVLKKQLYIS